MPVMHNNSKLCSVEISLVLLLLGGVVSNRAWPNESPLPESERPAWMDNSASQMLALSVDEAVQRSLQNSFRILRAKRSLESAQLRLQDVSAQSKPRIDLGVNINDSIRTSRYQQSRRIYTEPYENVLNGSLTASVYLPIDITGSNHLQRRQAELSSASVHINHDQVIRDLETDVRSAYIEALRSQEDIEAEEMSLERLRMLIQRIPPARSDLRNFLGVELAGGLQTLGASRQSLELAQGSLLQLLRLPSRPRLRLTSRLPAEIPEVNAYTVLEQGLVRRSDLQDARLRVEQAELALKQVGEYRKPSAGVFAYSGLSQSVHSRNRDYNSKSSYAAIMFNLNIPLFQWDWGMLNNQERSALLNLEQARDDLMEQQERASAELRQMLSSLSQVRQRLRSLPNPDLALEALASAEKSLLESSQWESAMAQVSNARHLWRSALSARIDALSDYYTVYLRLQRSVGEAPTVQ